MQQWALVLLAKENNTIAIDNTKLSLTLKIDRPQSIKKILIISNTNQHRKSTKT